MKLNAYAGKTDKGPFLNVNEDLFDIDLSQNLFMLIDAFGGAGLGDICAEKIAAHMRKMYSRISDDPDATLSLFYASQYQLEGNALINAALLAHRQIYNDNGKKEMAQRAGASGAFLSFSENIVNVLSIGNCRAYHYCLGKIQKLYEEDATALLGPGMEDETKIPLNAFGLYDYLHFTFKEARVAPGDFLILLSDGAYNSIGQDEIKAIVERNTLNLSDGITEIFTLANKRNNLDNQSCIILSF